MKEIQFSCHLTSYLCSPAESCILYTVLYDCMYERPTKLPFDRTENQIKLLIKWFSNLLVGRKPLKPLFSELQGTRKLFAELNIKVKLIFY